LGRVLNKAASGLIFHLRQIKRGIVVSGSLVAHRRTAIMPDTNGNECVENGGRTIYDGRFAAVETRTAAAKTDVAVIRASFATKDNIQLLRSEMYAEHERILSLLYEHKLQMQTVMTQQREEFHAALAKQRENFHAALAKLA
jgi:hypothetical protein